MNEATPPASPRSNFVTVVAWVFICAGGGFGLIALLEVLASLFIPTARLQEAMNGNGAMPLPGYTRFIMSHFTLFTVVSFAGMAALFVSAIGLLKRLSWARPAMVVLLAIGAIRNVAGTALELSFYSSLPAQAPAKMPAEAAAGVQAMMTGVIYVSAAFSLAIAGLLVWIITRLLSTPIRAEFQQPQAADAEPAPASGPAN